MWGYRWKGKEETCVVGEHRDKGLSVAAAGCAADAWHYTGHAGYSSTLSMQAPACIVNIGSQYSGRDKAVRSITLHVHYT